MKRLLTGLLIALFAISINTTVHAAGPTLEVGEARSLGTQVKVPVTIANATYVTSGQVQVILKATADKVSFEKFEPTATFNGKQYRTFTNNTDNVITIDFQSQTATEPNLNNKPTTIGYIIYNVTSAFENAETVPLEISSLIMKGRKGADIKFDKLDGSIERKMPIGDVIGKDEPTVAGAMRILQHLNGNTITDKETFLSADVDKDGTLTQVDAQYILDFVSGKRTSFLAIARKELDAAILKSDYTTNVEAFHGRAPYTFTRKTGSLPAGLTLNADTGEISGKATTAKSYTFTIQVTDTLGNTAERLFTIDVVDSNITSVEKLLPINVKQGEVPTLPSTVNVVYKDKTTGKETVTWEPVNTSTFGETVARGVIGTTGFKVTVPINVVSENYLNKISIGFIQFLNVHTVTVDVTSKVYSVTVNNVEAVYEGKNRFSIANSGFKTGSTVTIKLFDKFGNLLETKMQILNK